MKSSAMSTTLEIEESMVSFSSPRFGHNLRRHILPDWEEDDCKAVNHPRHQILRIDSDEIIDEVISHGK